MFVTYDPGAGSLKGRSEPCTSMPTVFLKIMFSEIFPEVLVRLGGRSETLSQELTRKKKNKGVVKFLLVG